jgi:methylamine utilization protein MauE
MVETISPVVYGTRARWTGALALHALGAAATAAAFGAVVAAAGAALVAPWGRAGGAIVAAVAALYLVRELGGPPIAVPQLRRQVPDWWRTYFGRPLAAFLYGAGLGVGFLTYLGHGTLVVVTVGIAATGRPGLGALLMAPFGAARGLAPLAAARSREPEDGRRLVDRLTSSSGRVRGALNAAAVGGVGIAAVAAASRATDGWSEAAAAIVAVTFGWAAIAKLAGWSRWRIALAGYGLPPDVERPARWAIPVVEASVVVLTMLQRQRTAAAIAAVALLLFTGALVRIGRRDGGRVACGCFGGRNSIDVRVALLRNLALVVPTVVAWAGAGRDPALRVPTGTDLLPVLLVAGSVVVATLTAWRTAVWVARGRT